MTRKKQRGREKKKKKFFLVRLYHFTLFCALLVLSLVFVLRFVVPVALEPGYSATTAVGEQRKQGIYTFLLVGSDNGDYNADSIMLVQFDGNTAGVNLISVPRDTLVERSWSSFPKINASFSKGIDLLQEELSYTLGIPIDFYVQVGLDAFIAVVDAVGGVEFDVPQDMYHDDEGGFIIDLQAGLQTLGGRQALELVRYRGYATADIGRTETQQAVLKALAQQMLQPENMLKWESYWGIFQEYVETNLSGQDFMWFANAVLLHRTEFSLYSQTLDGVGNGKYNGYTWCYVLDQAKTVDTVNLYLNPYESPRSLGDMNLLLPDSYH